MNKFRKLLCMITIMLTISSCSNMTSGINNNNINNFGNNIVDTYIEQLKLEDRIRCQSCSIKFMSDNYNSSASYYITPSGFEMDKLEKKGYYMKITVSYSFRYKKDYDVVLDIGYAGAPKYDASIINSDGFGKIDKDLSPTKTNTSKTLSFTQSITNIKNQRWILSFSTENIQNIIYVENIVVDYKCIK